MVGKVLSIFKDNKTHMNKKDQSFKSHILKEKSSLSSYQYSHTGNKNQECLEIKAKSQQDQKFRIKFCKSEKKKN